MVFWLHRVKKTRERSDELQRKTTLSERRVRASTKRLETASNHAERAAVAILARDDELLRLAARRH